MVVVQAEHQVWWWVWWRWWGEWCVVRVVPWKEVRWCRHGSVSGEREEKEEVESEF